MKRTKITLLDLVGIGIGQIIGSGVMILTGLAVGKTGHGVPLAFIVAGIIVAITNLCLATLGSAIPANGGMYTYVRDLIGKKTGFFYVALLAAGQLVLANYAIGFAEYLKELVPAINVTLVAAVMMTLVFIINLTGIKSAVRFQNLLVVILILSIALFIVLGLPKVGDFSPYFDMATIMPNGFSEFVAAIFLVRFSLVGAEYINEFGSDAENPGKNIPLAMIISTVVVSVVYLGVGFVATGVLPIEEVAFQTLGNVAHTIFSKPIYFFFMIGGAMFAVASSLNAVFAWAPKGLAVAVDDGWLPQFLAQENKTFGTPHYLLTIFYVIGMIPILTGGTLEIIAVLGNNIGLIFAALPIIAVMFLPSKNPEAYANAYFKLPRWAMSVLPIFCLIIFAGGFYSNVEFIGAFGMKVLFGYCVLVAVYAKVKEPHLNPTKGVER
ncbi:APC family permease [Peptoniphilus equinus]|uniref:APC family permease n=1 Tax=Peptoniphilus equinus TaxID=3016343 RepID=A0ABY7QU56_9FIRM|nr:APC family permease [Peptoniphilus equinus]WBW49555.1 APC family permease [Peptoniphilus equinus]